jgi:hypothetical protein
MGNIEECPGIVIDVINELGGYNRCTQLMGSNFDPRKRH